MSGRIRVIYDQMKSSADKRLIWVLSKSINRFSVLRRLTQLRQSARRFLQKSFFYRDLFSIVIVSYLSQNEIKLKTYQWSHGSLKRRFVSVVKDTTVLIQGIQ